MGHRLVCSMLALATFAASPAAAADPDVPQNLGATVSISADFAKAFKAPAQTHTLVLGNRSIASVVFDMASSVVVVVGKSYGTTNMILLDSKGLILAQTDITVGPPSRLVTVQRGQDRATYTCAPTCAPALTLGDGPQTQTLGSQMQARETLNAPPK